MFWTRSRRHVVTAGSCPTVLAAVKFKINHRGGRAIPPATPLRSPRPPPRPPLTPPTRPRPSSQPLFPGSPSCPQVPSGPSRPPLEQLRAPLCGSRTVISRLRSSPFGPQCLQGILLPSLWEFRPHSCLSHQAVRGAYRQFWFQ